MQAQGVVVVAAPRTGSTLCLGLLNALPDVHIVGEWGQPLTYLMRMHMAVWHQQARNHGAVPDERWPHHGLVGVDLDEWLTDLAQTYRKILPPARTQGFKEVFWDDLEPREYASYVNIVHRALGSDVVWVCLTRPDRVSEWTAPALAFQNYLRDNELTHDLDYQTLLADPDMVCSDLARAVLRRELSPDEWWAMRMVLSQPHSTSGRVPSALMTNVGDYSSAFEHRDKWKSQHPLGAKEPTCR